MSFDKITVFTDVLHQNVIEIVHRKLIECPRWSIAVDRMPIDLFQRAQQATDSGLILCSYKNEGSDSKFYSHDNIDPAFRDLNFYADLIFELCLQRCFDEVQSSKLPIFANIRAARYFWNYYHCDSKGTLHMDHNEHDYWSIIFYLNSCAEGSTIIIDDLGVQHTIQHMPGNAVIFPSTFQHRGTSPNKNHHRCCLNILFTADKMHNTVSTLDK